MINKLLHILILLLMATEIANGFCPSKCSCAGDHNLRASCINAGLEVVPIQLNPDVKYINLTTNKIQNVHFTLAFYTKLEILDLSRNKLDSLGSKNFESQENLQTLNLSQNLLTNLSKDAFKGLKNIFVLDLSYNKIEMIYSNALLDLERLIKLDMTNNNIVSFEDGIFRNMRSLEILILRNNQMLDVPYENLDYTTSLKTLDLSGNLIEYVRNNSFENQKELSLLNFQGNVISYLDMDAFDGLIGLKILDFADNNLTFVPTIELSKLTNLTYLSLSGNCFTSIPPVALLNLFHLRELYLDRLDSLIKIDSRAFVDNTHLQIVSLDNNPSFTDLPLRLFHGNPNIVEISIRGNYLQTLDAAQFPLDRLQRLRLGDNPLICNCSLLWLWRLTTGQYENDVSDENINLSNVLLLDKDDIGCNVIEENIVRKKLKTMSESDIKCPGHLLTIICAALSISLFVITGASVIIYIKYVKRRKKNSTESKNVNERIVPQQVDKLELERYLAAQALANEYRALRPWEIPVKPETSSSEDQDHYEKFEYFERRAHNKPHVVYV